MTALDLINRLDDGLAVSPADLAVLEIAEQDASNRWYRIDQQVELWQADVCYCGQQEAEDGECVSCHNDIERAVARAGDL